MDLAQMPVAHASGPLIGVELLTHPAQEPDLVEPRAVAHLDREGARADLGEERAAIALLHGIERVLPVGDQAGEYVDAPDRAFRIGEGGDGGAQVELLDERHEIDAAGFEHGAMGELDLVEFELAELVAHGRVRPRQEARADAISDLAQPEIEARRLNLVRRDLRRRPDLATGDQRFQRLGGQDAGAGERALHRRPRLGARPLGKAAKQPVALNWLLHGSLSWHSPGRQSSLPRSSPPDSQNAPYHSIC